MKYYSDITKSFYETEKEALEAEKKHQELISEKQEREKKLKEERKTRAHEIEVARDAMNEAEQEYSRLLKAFINDYGYYHQTITKEGEMPFKTLFDAIRLF